MASDLTPIKADPKSIAIKSEPDTTPIKTESEDTLIKIESDTPKQLLTAVPKMARKAPEVSPALIHSSEVCPLNSEASAVSIAGRKRSGSPLEDDRSDPYAAARRVKPHNPDDETEPKLATFHPRAQFAEGRAYDTYDEILKMLATAPHKSDYITSLHKSIKEKTLPAYSTAEKRLMVNGEAGKGKRFTLGNVLGFRDLCIQAGGPKGCTNVSPDYHYPRATQNTPFAAKVMLPSLHFAIDKVKSYIADAVKFLEYQATMDARSNVDSDDDYDNDLDTEGQELLQRFDAALLALSALFCADPNFRDRDATEEYLKGIDTLDHDRVTQCCRRMERIYTELVGNDLDGDKTTFEGADVATLRNRLHHFITDTHDSMIPGTSIQCCPWPIVENISIGAMCRVLKPGVTLFDIPGLGDTNSANEDRARRSLQDADVIMVVGHLARVQASKTIGHELKWAFKRRGREGVIMVCTHSDASMINDHGTTFLRQDHQKLREITDKISEVEKKHREFERENMRAMCAGDSPRIIESGKQMEACVEAKRTLENLHFEVRVLARNRTTMDPIRTWYAKQTKGAYLPMFCVSNTEYDKYLAGYPKEDPPKLSLEATGIPALRNHIYSLPAKARFATLDYHLTAQREILFSRLEYFCTASTSQQRDDVLPRIIEMRSKAAPKIEAAYKALMESRLGCVKKVLGDAEDDWKKHAMEKCCDNWSKLPARTFNTLLKKKGDHNGRVAGKMAEWDWNQSLLEPVIKNVDKVFASLRQEGASELAENIASSLAKSFRNLIQTLRDDPAGAAACANPDFIRGLKNRESEVDKECRDVADEFSKSLRSIQDDAVTLGAKSMFPPHMNKVYERVTKVTKQRGVTLHRLRCSEFRAALAARDGPFRGLYLDIARECRKAITASQSEMKRRVDRIFEELEADMEHAYSACEDDTSPESIEFRQRLRNLLDQKRKVFDQEIIPALEDARKVQSGIIE